MKKFLALILCALLALSFTACSSGGLQIAIPNDTTNEARALLLLEANGIIKLKEGAGITATIMDIAENPKNSPAARVTHKAYSDLIVLIHAAKIAAATPIAAILIMETSYNSNNSRMVSNNSST